MAPYGIEQRTPYSRYAEETIDDHLRETHGARTVEVDSLPGDDHAQVLGMYDPNTDTVYILKSLSPYVKRFVLEHEYVHRERHFKGQSQDEAIVDREAELRLGYNPLPRGSGTYLHAA
jgi:Zn-dependent peptidase ImmA (M78 family)